MTVTGQTSSEMFTWYMWQKTCPQIDTVLGNNTHLTKNLKQTFRNSTEEVLDIVCAELKFEDQNQPTPRLLPDTTTLANDYFPEFKAWWSAIRMKCATQVQVSRHRAVALLIPGLVSDFSSPDKVSDTQLGVDREICFGS